MRANILALLELTVPQLDLPSHQVAPAVTEVSSVSIRELLSKLPRSWLAITLTRMMDKSSLTPSSVLRTITVPRVTTMRLVILPRPYLALMVNGLSLQVTLRSMIASLAREVLSVLTLLKLLMLLIKPGMKTEPVTDLLGLLPY